MLQSIDRYIMKILCKYLKENTSETLLQLVKSLIVGGIATIVDLGLLYVLTDWLDVFYIISGIFSFVVALTINYVIATIWVFNRRSIANRRVEFTVFTFIAIIGLGLNTLFMYVFTDLVGVHYLISKAIATVFVYGWNFSARKMILYR